MTRATTTKRRARPVSSTNTKAAREARLQMALVALRDSLIEVGSAWMSKIRTQTIRGTSRMTLRIEPVWEPITVDNVTAALARNAIVPRPIRPHAELAIRALHTPSGVELDLSLADTISRSLKRHLDRTMGRGWERRRPGRSQSGFGAGQGMRRKNT